MAQSKNTDKKPAEHSILKISFAALLSVFTGAALILGSISFGMNVQRNIDERNGKTGGSGDISVIGVDYSSELFNYVYGGGYGTKEDVANEPKNKLLKRIGASEDDNYYIIDSSSKLDNVKSAISYYAGSNINYSVESNFFYTGSVILVNKEAYGLSGLKVRSVSRDGNYNIQIDVDETYGNDNVLDGGNGSALLVKVGNIQPKSVKVNFFSEK